MGPVREPKSHFPNPSLFLPRLQQEGISAWAFSIEQNHPPTLWPRRIEARCTRRLRAISLEGNRERQIEAPVLPV